MLTRSKRGALVYTTEKKGTGLDDILAWAAIIAGLLYFILAGLPGDPLHGASKYQAKSCAGLIECAQEWGEDGEENKEEEGEAVTVYDYRGRA